MKKKKNPFVKFALKHYVAILIVLLILIGLAIFVAASPYKIDVGGTKIWSTDDNTGLNCGGRVIYTNNCQYPILYPDKTVSERYNLKVNAPSCVSRSCEETDDGSGGSGDGCVGCGEATSPPQESTNTYGYDISESYYGDVGIVQVS